MPAISIVIPLYNKATSVSRSINSVLQQSFSHFELIIVDDGSTDNSLNIVQSYQDKRITIIQQQNQGASVARNNGVLAANSEFIAFLDADDCYHPDFLQRIINLTEQYSDAALFSCRFNFVDETGKTFSPKGSLPEDYIGEITPFYPLFKQNRALIHPSSMAVNKKLFLACGGFPAGKTVGEDLQLILSMALQGKVVSDLRICATIHRDAENRTQNRAEIKPGCHLEYFFKSQSWQQNIAADTIEQLKDFLIHNALLHSAGAALLGQRSLAYYYAKLIWQQSPLNGIIAFAIAVMPQRTLAWLKQKRNND
ncbi:glycosyltransferase family A protein [Rheinheimera sp. MMS21-TC3]|uniref:glycosyltransferase family A protein n=1 Tax=Rheinheimera sp. MMS21-TC3 TaxID=3072790 RepID=UPI0028C4E30B|nr:glycosyltransferase family A protein [Rheinheimera sp. MMS21-TC3]WNO61671.1 glycosyltransferase family A protein [Rheinheimera sp. MMS21-TC3]